MIRIVEIVRRPISDQENQSITVETLRIQLLLSQELKNKTNGQLTFLSVQEEREKEQSRRPTPVGIVRPLPLIITID